MDSRGSLERRLGSVHGKFVSRSLVQLSSCTPAGALWSCWQTLTGLNGGASSEQVEPWAEGSGKMQSRPGVPGGSRESGYDSIRERVALVPFLHGRILADGRPSAVGLSFGTQRVLPTFCEQRLSPLSEAET
jgi:hypothetical protein